jgi:hypothetical protein
MAFANINPNRHLEISQKSFFDVSIWTHGIRRVYRTRELIPKKPENRSRRRDWAQSKTKHKECDDYEDQSLSQFQSPVRRGLQVLPVGAGR